MHTRLHLNSIKAKKKKKKLVCCFSLPCPPSLSTTHYFQTISIRHNIHKTCLVCRKQNQKKTSTQTQKKVKLKTCITDNIAQENQCEYNMSIVVIVVSSSLVLLASSLNEGRRLQDRGPSSHNLPSFVSFFLSFPLLLLFVLVWVILSQLKSLFFFFLGFFGGCFSRAFRVSSCERLTAYRCSLTAS